MSTHDHTSSCCHKAEPQEQHHHHEHEAGDSCCPPKEKTDWLLWGSAILVAIGFVLALLPVKLPGVLNAYAEGVYELASRMWWGVLIGLVMVGFLSKVPREFVLSVMGKGGTFTGLVRAVLAGVLLDLCNHGILMVGAKLYERGASYGQVVAFLVASPWNSFSLTLVLVALIGLKWTIAFIVFSMVIALIAGIVFDVLERKGVIAANPSKADLPEVRALGWCLLCRCGEERCKRKPHGAALDIVWYRACGCCARLHDRRHVQRLFWPNAPWPSGDHWRRHDHRGMFGRLDALGR